MFLAGLTTFAQSRFIGIEILKTTDDYQQYVGKTVVFYKPTDERAQRFDLDKIYEGAEYVIEKIEGKTTSDNNIKLTFSFLLKGDNKAKPTKVVCYNSTHIVGFSLSQAPVAHDMPLFFVDKKEEMRKQYMGYIGKELLVNGESVIIKRIQISRDKRFDSGYYIYPSFVYVNTLTGEESTEQISTALSGSYYSVLSKVEKPADDSIRYGESTVIEDEGVSKYSYVDNVLSIIIFGTSEKFSFVLRNLSDNSIKVVWNEAVFVDMDGATSKIMHAGTKYSQRDGDQPASVIIKGAKLEDVATPTANVYYSELFKEWMTRSMFPKEPGLSGTVRLMLPIQIKDTINEYIFEFDINYSYNHPELH